MTPTKDELWASYLSAHEETIRLWKLMGESVWKKSVTQKLTPEEELLNQQYKEARQKEDHIKKSIQELYGK